MYVGLDMDGTEAVDDTGKPPASSGDETLSLLSEQNGERAEKGGRDE